MKLSFWDMFRLHVENLDWLDVTLMLLLVLELAVIVVGVIAFVQRRTGATGPRRWSRVSIAIGLVAVVLAVAGLAMHHLRMLQAITELGWNVTPTDYTLNQMDEYLILMFGLLTAAVGLAGGWALEWLVDGREAESSG
jgi:hypothetical protein